MDEKTVTMIKERFDSLPEMVQEVIISSKYEDSLVEISKKYQLNVEQMGILEQETTFVMMGLSPIGDFEEELVRELKIDKTKISQIVTEINEKIFLNIRALLKLMYTPRGEEPSLEEESGDNKITMPDNNGTGNLESREELLKAISSNKLAEKPAEKTPEQKVEPASMIPEEFEPELTSGGEEKKQEPAPSILSQKLSESYKVPTTETEHSVPNLAPKADSKPNLPKIDPYREPI